MTHGRLEQYVILGKNDFSLRGRFIVHAANAEMDHCYIYSGWTDFTWLFGINREMRPCIWMGDGSSWSIFNGMEVIFQIKLGCQYELILERQGEELYVAIDGRFLAKFPLPSDFQILGSRLGIQMINMRRSAWDVNVEVPTIEVIERDLVSEKFGKTVNLVSVF